MLTCWRMVMERILRKFHEHVIFNTITLSLIELSDTLISDKIILLLPLYLWLSSCCSPTNMITIITLWLAIFAWIAWTVEQTNWNLIICKLNDARSGDATRRTLVQSRSCHVGCCRVSLRLFGGYRNASRHAFARHPFITLSAAHSQHQPIHSVEMWWQQRGIELCCLLHVYIFVRSAMLFMLYLASQANTVCGTFTTFCLFARIAVA